MPEADPVADVESTGGDQFGDGVEGGNPAVDEDRDLFEVLVEGAQEQRSEQRLDIEATRLLGRVHDGIEKWLTRCDAA